MTVGRSDGQTPEVPGEFEALYRTYARTVTMWAARLGGPGLDVEDAVQEVFMTARRRLPAFEGRAKVTTWLYRTTLRVVQAQRRRKRRHLWRWAEVDGRDLQAPVRTPADALEGRQTAELVYRALDRLKDKHRTVIIAFEIEGLSGEEIAAMMDTKVATIWVWLHRARARFLEELAKLGVSASERANDPQG